MKYLVSILVGIISIGWGGITQGYFEDRYFCEIQKSKIIVTLQQSGTSKPCIELMQSVQQQISSIQKELQTVQGYLRSGGPRSYREPVQKNLELRRGQIQSFQVQLSRAINSFEFSLFIRLRKLVVFSFKTLHESLSKDLIAYEQQFDDLKTLGVVSNGDELRKNYNEAYYKHMLLSRMFSSRNFGELIPSLMNYLAYDTTKTVQFGLADLLRIEQQLGTEFTASQRTKGK